MAIEISMLQDRTHGKICPENWGPSGTNTQPSHKPSCSVREHSLVSWALRPRWCAPLEYGDGKASVLC